MISTNRVLDELQRQLTHAKMTSDEASMRESIAAMHSLCALILGEASGQMPSAGSDPMAGASPIGTAAPTETLATPVPSGLEGNVLEEEDANGGSLFDF